MWSLCKLSLFQMLSGTWKVNDHLPQQDCDSLPPSQLEGLNHLPKAPGMSSAEQEPKAGPVGRAGTSEPQLLSLSCQLHPAAIYRAEVSHHPCKHPTSELQHRVIFEEYCKPKPLWPFCRGQTTAFLLISCEATQRCVNTSAYLTESSQKGFKWCEKLLFFHP